MSEERLNGASKGVASASSLLRQLREPDSSKLTEATPMADMSSPVDRPTTLPDTTPSTPPDVKYSTPPDTRPSTPLGDRHTTSEEGGAEHPLSRSRVVKVNVHPRREEVSEEGSDHEDDVDLDLCPDGLHSLGAQNQFTVRKMAAQGLIDVALMMANISQLRTLITAGPDLDYYSALLVLVCFSLTAQVTFAIIIFIIYLREAEDNQRHEFMAHLRQGDPESNKLTRAKIEKRFQRHQLTNRLNYITIILVFTITVTNMFITGFGIKLVRRSV